MSFYRKLMREIQPFTLAISSTKSTLLYPDRYVGTGISVFNQDPAIAVRLRIGKPISDNTTGIVLPPKGLASVSSPLAVYAIAESGSPNIEVQAYTQILASTYLATKGEASGMLGISWTINNESTFATAQTNTALATRVVPTGKTARIKAIQGTVEQAATSSSNVLTIKIRDATAAVDLWTKRFVGNNGTQDFSTSFDVPLSAPAGNTYGTYLTKTGTVSQDFDTNLQGWDE